MILTSRLIVTTGMATGGKTTIARALTQSIANAVYLDRDGAMYGGLLVVNDIAMKTTRLPTFNEYVSRDSVFPDFVEVITTPFGPMHRVIHANHNDFFWRHADRQSYLVAARFAEENLKLGKVVVLDAWFSPEHFRDGTVRAFLNQPSLAGFPCRFIYVAVGHDEAFRRWHVRAAEDLESNLRGKSGYLNRATFIEKMAHEQPTPHQKGLDEIQHLYLDTTHLSREDSIAAALEYVARP